MAHDACLVISDGGTASLLACAAAADRPSAGAGPGRSVVWIASAPGPDDPQMRTSAIKQAELFGLSYVQGYGPDDFGSGRSGPVERAVTVMLRAALAAADAKVPVVVVPAIAGPTLDLPTCTRVLDRALLVSRLVAVEVGPDKAPEIRVPYADFTDEQVADLILDMDLPIWTCWWWAGHTVAAVAERTRWAEALKRVGWQGDLPEPATVTVSRRDPTRAPGTR